MSAINPASFITPTAGLQLPSGIGPGALAAGRDRFADSRGRRDNPEYAAPTLSGIQGTFDQQWTVRSDVGANPFLLQNAYGHFYNPQFQDMMPASNGHGAQQQFGRSESPFNTQVFGQFRHSPNSAPDSQNMDDGYGNRLNGWSAAFQGLSLGS
jgi:hypothetical protein